MPFPMTLCSLSTILGGMIGKSAYQYDTVLILMYVEMAGEQVRLMP